MEDPLKTFAITKEIGGSKIDITCAAFEDRNLVVVTQFKKVGTIVSVKTECVQGGKPTFHTSVLLGEDTPIIHVYARALAEVIKHGQKSGGLQQNFEVLRPDKPLLCTLALKDFSSATLTGICGMLKLCEIF